MHSLVYYHYCCGLGSDGFVCHIGLPYVTVIQILTTNWFEPYYLQLSEYTHKAAGMPWSVFTLQPVYFIVVGLEVMVLYVISVFTV